MAPVRERNEEELVLNPFQLDTGCWVCSRCSKKFSRKDVAQRHIKSRCKGEQASSTQQDSTKRGTLLTSRAKGKNGETFVLQRETTNACWRCPLCGQEFTIEDTVHRHLLNSCKSVSGRSMSMTESGGEVEDSEMMEIGTSTNDKCSTEDHGITIDHAHSECRGRNLNLEHGLGQQWTCPNSCSR